MNSNAKCKICRRLGEKLFLKGDKCMSPKCLMVRKSYAPGGKRKRRTAPLSEYGKELREKQKLKNWYNLDEQQLKRYVKESLAATRRRATGSTKEDDARVILIRKLESRLDSAVFRLGLASSRAHARQLVSYGHFLVNKKNVDVPAYQLKKGDEVSVRPGSSKKKYFQDLIPILKRKQVPSWLKLDGEKLKGEFIGQPSLEEAAPAVEIPAIFEYYSR